MAVVVSFTTTPSPSLLLPLPPPPCASAGFYSTCPFPQGRRWKEFGPGEGLLPVRASWKASCVLETRAAQYHNFGFNHLASSACIETAKDGHQSRFSNINGHGRTNLSMKKLVLPCAVTHMSARVNMSLQIARAVDDDVRRRDAMASILLGSIFFIESTSEATLAQPAVVFREYVDAFDGYSFKYPKNWIQVRGAGADIFYRDPFVLDENLSVELSSPSSSRYLSVEDLGSPHEAGDKMLKQYLTEFMSTRLGVRRESSILSTSSRVADDGRLYYEVEANIKSYANTNELAVMPEDRVVRLEWDRRYLSVLGVENNRLYELRLQTPEKVFKEEEDDLRQVMESFRVTKVLN